MMPARRAVALTAAAALAALVWRRWRPAMVVVEGDSMEPSIAAGRRLVVVRVLPHELRAGTVVVARPRSRPGLEVVKRIAAGPGDLAPNGDVLGPDAWFLIGDRPERSTDSRHFGPVPSSAIVARAVRVR